MSAPSASHSAQHGITSKPDKTIMRCAAIARRIFADCATPGLAVRLWDGSMPVRPADGEPRFCLEIRHPAALRRMLLPPSELNLGEAFVFGDYDISGDILAATGLMDHFERLRLPPSDVLWLLSQLLALPADYAAGRVRAAPHLRGVRHTRQRDRRSVQFHYDLSNDFYALWLGEQMVYSCAYFRTGDEDIDTAQELKLDYICRKLRLQPGERLLDIGCGWGALVMHAAQHYAADATGITLSRNQATEAQRRIDNAGLRDRCRVILQDYREVPPDRPFDKLVSIGMFEHVGETKLPGYFARAYDLLRPGGLFLNHGISAMKAGWRSRRTLGELLLRRNSFMNRHVFPDGELVDISRSLAAAEESRFEVRDVECLREHYALTLRHWVRALETRHDEAIRHVDEPTYRVWRLYMAGVHHGFVSGRINVYQALLLKPDAEYSSLPLTREHLYR